MITLDGMAPQWAQAVIRQIDQLLTQLFAPMNISASGTITTQNATAATAGGLAMLLFGTTAGFGIYAGSGPPTISAGQGSLYLRTDGSTSTSRAFINTTGSTVWTAVNTVA